MRKRVLVVGVVSITALVWDGAVGIGGAGPAGDLVRPPAQVVSASPAPVVEGSEGGQVTTSNGVTQARLGTTAVSAVTTSCPDGRRWDTDLNLMERSSLHSHCDFP